MDDADSAGPARQLGESDVLRSGSLELDLTTRVATRGDQECTLTTKQAAVLAVLMRRDGEVATREELRNQANVSGAALANHLAAIKRMLGEDLIRTEGHTGYRLSRLARTTRVPLHAGRLTLSHTRTLSSGAMGHALTVLEDQLVEEVFRAAGRLVTDEDLVGGTALEGTDHARIRRLIMEVRSKLRPFVAGHLLVRVTSLGLRVGSSPGYPRVAGIEFDRGRRRVRVNGQELSLPAPGYRCLTRVAAFPGRAVALTALDAGAGGVDTLATVMTEVMDRVNEIAPGLIASDDRGYWLEIDHLGLVAVGAVVHDPAAQTVSFGDRAEQLSANQSELLGKLMDAAGDWVSRSRLAEVPGIVRDATVTDVLRGLRRALHRLLPQVRGELIATAEGFGARLAAELIVPLPDSRRSRAPRSEGTD